MFYTGLFKRIIPFVLTFAAGLLLASLFVPITPNFREWRSENGHKCQEKRQLRMENDELREQKRKLQIENDRLRRSAKNWNSDEILDAVPPVDIEEHDPPAPPRKPKRPRIERIN